MLWTNIKHCITILSNLLKIYVRKIEGAIKYGQYRDTGRGGNKTKNEAIQNKNKTQHNIKKTWKDEQHGSYRKTEGEPICVRRVNSPCFSYDTRHVFRSPLPKTKFTIGIVAAFSVFAFSKSSTLKNKGQLQPKLG
jgi:hypothetical protein